MTDATARNAGFTQIEALIATLLMSIILGVLGTITQLWLSNWDRGIVRLQSAELVAVGMERLVADFAAAEIVTSGDVLVFDGTVHSVIFVRTRIRPGTPAGLEIVRIAATNDSRGPALVRSTAPFVPAGVDLAQLDFVDPVVVFRGPYRVSFSFAGSDRVWRDSWRGASHLPRAIRVLVQDAASLATLAVSTSTPIRAEVPARCVMMMTRLNKIESRLGSNDGANAAFDADCLGQTVSAGSVASSGGNFQGR